jgi:hypothetical protein
MDARRASRCRWQGKGGAPSFPSPALPRGYAAGQAGRLPTRVPRPLRWATRRPATGLAAGASMLRRATASTLRRSPGGPAAAAGIPSSHRTGWPTRWRRWGWDCPRLARFRARGTACQHDTRPATDRPTRPRRPSAGDSRARSETRASAGCVRRSRATGRRNAVRPGNRGRSRRGRAGKCRPVRHASQTDNRTARAPGS